MLSRQGRRVHAVTRSNLHTKMSFKKKYLQK